MIQGSTRDWPSRYLQDVRQVLTHPTDFFRSLNLNDGLSYPLAFALINHWLGSAFTYLWHGLLEKSIGQYSRSLFSVFEDVVEIESPGRAAQWNQLKERFLHWVWGTGSVLVDPFLTLAYILFLSSLIYVGARLLVNPGQRGAPEQIRFEGAVRLVCFGMTPTLFNVVPLLGTGISTLLTLILTVLGAREIYRVDWLRAMGIGLFPLVLFGLLSFGVLGFFAFLIFKLLAPLFGF